MEVMMDNMESLGDVLRRVAPTGGVYADPDPLEEDCLKCSGIGFLGTEPDKSDKRKWRRGPIVPCPDCSPRFPESFENFNVDPRWPRMQQALVATQNWVGGIGPAMLSLAGEPGRGKSHLMLAAVQYLRDHMLPTKHMTDRQLDTMFRASFDAGNTSTVLDELEAVPWLLLDDYGIINRGEPGSTMNSLLDDIFVVRWNRARAGHNQVRTMITTNMSGDDLPMRMASRLQDRTRAIHVVIKAPDYRREVREE